jgi:predicted kinase
MEKIPILCVDFDGVLHSYISGWKGARNIPDPPVPGAIDWSRSLLTDPDCVCSMAPRYKDFDVQIYSSRSRYLGARRAMKEWLKKWFDYYCYEPSCVDELLKFPKEKPPASLLIDDRGFRFNGQFPTVEQMIGLLKPWNKKHEKQDQAELVILVGNIGCGKSWFAKQRAKRGDVIINMDSITEMIGGGYDNYDKKKKEIYWAVEEIAICEALERGFSVIIDRTNMDKKCRKRFIDIGKRYDWVTIKCLDWGEGGRECLKRRVEDPRGIGAERWVEVWAKKRLSYEKPTKEEGFDFITEPIKNILRFINDETP